MTVPSVSITASVTSAPFDGASHDLMCIVVTHVDDSEGASVLRPSYFLSVRILIVSRTINLHLEREKNIFTRMQENPLKHRRKALSVVRGRQVPNGVLVIEGPLVFKTNQTTIAVRLQDNVQFGACNRHCLIYSMLVGFEDPHLRFGAVPKSFGHTRHDECHYC